MNLDPTSAQELAARVAAEADLLDVRMLESQFELHKLPDDGLTYNLDLTHKVEHEDGEDFFVVRIQFELDIELEDGHDEKSKVAHVSFELGALYTLAGHKKDDEPSEEEFAAYAETSATLTLFPYAREYVSDVTQRMGLPKLLLPVHRLPSPWHRDDDDERAAVAST